MAATHDEENNEYMERLHSQFGPLTSTEYLYAVPPVTSLPGNKRVLQPVTEEYPPYFYVICTYISYLLLIIIGHVEDFIGKRMQPKKYLHLMEHDGYAPLNSDFDNFYIRKLKTRLDYCFSRPTTGVPGRFITVYDRVSHDNNETFTLTGSTRDCLNLSSYNYLGFAQSVGACADAAVQALKKYGTASGSSRSDGGTTDLIVETEALVANFVGKEDCIICSQGFGTNAAVFMSLVGKGCLIVSDELNHASIRFGSRLTGAVIKAFKHNDMNALEDLLREQIAQGQPRTHRPWRKVLVVVEGLYSMEGTFCNLPELVRLRRKYKFFLFVDEAHSIGALGSRGKGVCDYFGVNPAEVDILMGTFTKSFGAAGGYIAGDKNLIDYMRLTNLAYAYSESMSSSIIAQINVAMRIINGEVVPNQGKLRLQRLAFNSRYFRLGLKRLGMIVSGDDDSPVIPWMLFSPGKMDILSKAMLQRFNIAIVVVGYPATPLVCNLVRFCMSSALTKEDLDYILKVCDELGDELDLKFSTGINGGGHFPGEVPRWDINEVIAKGVQDCKKISL